MLDFLWLNCTGDTCKRNKQCYNYDTEDVILLNGHRCRRCYSAKGTQQCYKFKGTVIQRVTHDEAVI